MTVTVSQQIDAPRQRVWDLITDADRWEDVISGIKTIEVVERPPSGIVGLKWREKRVMFGKEAWETMWISDADPGYWYETTAENHGTRYTTRVSAEDRAGGTLLTMNFSAQATSFAARILSILAVFANGGIRKALQQDLDDIRSAAEAA